MATDRLLVALETDGDPREARIRRAAPLGGARNGGCRGEDRGEGRGEGDFELSEIDEARLAPRFFFARSGLRRRQPRTSQQDFENIM